LLHSPNSTLFPYTTLFRSQSDLAFLEAENVDWQNNLISYRRMKTNTVAIMRLDAEMAEILKDLPGNGPLFPYLRKERAIARQVLDRKSTRLNSSHVAISYA